jgi:uncharacterized protein GlcG (DUF336 family)
MLQRNLFTGGATFVVAMTFVAGAASAQTCATLPDHAKLKAALIQATKDETSGLNNQMWGTIVDRDGVVCAVAFSGTDRFSQWPGSRVISAQKANTANAFGLDSGSNSNGSGQANGLSLSTANLFSAVQPGGSLYGLQFSNPVNEDAGYKVPSAAYGTPTDPMKGSKIGGVNVFGGGLALFTTGKKMVGGIGVSGDTSCADHFIAWRLRKALGLDHLMGVGGVSGDPQRPDNIVFDIGANGQSAGGFGHPKCLMTGNEKMLPVVQP